MSVLASCAGLQTRAQDSNLMTGYRNHVNKQANLRCIYTVQISPSYRLQNGWIAESTLKWTSTSGHYLKGMLNDTYFMKLGNIPCNKLQIQHERLFLMMTSSNGNISALLALCAGNSPVTGEFPSQRPVMQSFGVFFDLRLNKRLSKPPWGWWFET